MCKYLEEDLKKSQTSKVLENDKLLNEILVAEKQKKLLEMDQKNSQLEEKMIKDKEEKDKLF